MFVSNSVEMMKNLGWSSRICLQQLQCTYYIIYVLYCIHALNKYFQFQSFRGANLEPLQNTTLTKKFLTWIRGPFKVLNNTIIILNSDYLVVLECGCGCECECECKSALMSSAEKLVQMVRGCTSEQFVLCLDMDIFILDSYVVILFSDKWTI